MSRTIHLIGARGGQGTSTVAAALALLAAGHHETALVSADPTAMAALLGSPPPLAGERAQVAPSLSFVTDPKDRRAEVTVVDAGSGREEPFSGLLRANDVERYAVLRGPCYVALASLLNAPGGPPDGVILVVEPGRALSAKDVTGVLDVPVVTTVKVSPAVARTIDAGLLVARLHRLCELAPLRRLAEKAPPNPDPRQHQRRNLKTVTDLPFPRGGNGAEGLARCQPGSRRPLSAAHRTAWGCDREARRSAEHRQARSRGSRLLLGRGRHLCRGLLHRQR